MYLFWKAYSNLDWSVFSLQKELKNELPPFPFLGSALFYGQKLP